MRVKSLETSIQALILLSEEMKSSRGTLKELIESICAVDSFKELDYYKAVLEGLCENKAFPPLWKDAIVDTKCEFADEDKKPLLLLGESLGSYSLEGQINAIECAVQSLTQRLESARQDKKERASMFVSLGMAAGAGIFAVLI